MFQLYYCDSSSSSSYLHPRKPDSALIVSLTFISVGHRGRAGDTELERWQTKPKHATATTSTTTQPQPQLKPYPFWRLIYHLAETVCFDVSDEALEIASKRRPTVLCGSEAAVNPNLM